MIRPLGAVLAGGQSSRFGTDKAQAILNGRTLVDHAIATLRRHCDEVVVIGSQAGGLPDLPRPGLGPLGGIAAALDHAATHGFHCVLTVGCDMPHLPDGLIEALLHRGPAYCEDAPVLGYWPSALGAHLLAHIETAPDRSVRGWAKNIGALPIGAATALANVNTRDDLAALESDMLTA
ncbi:hypothetical protein ASG67_04055 [Sphingomonas sp. Leaf339]|uniref:molybdenum cofactor guanylyltransferase n=1 Tax=Sphingomonas sp. Leaf339 TaxID=1736343 RepID=UPI0006FBC6B6|nr:molybdenum cofactor guanylyltransferase [Sphingomonas sp. Leaf339]KQU62281.1 hypothetical protein ASG67_04055 [Sphingomonas sp. Leaf339]